MTPKVNLRGERVSFDLDGRTMEGVVVTHIRNHRWMIQSPQLPKQYARNGAWWAPRRVVLHRNAFTLAATGKEQEG